MKKQRLLPYRQSVPSILLFQIISSLALQIWMSCFSVISRLLIRSTGHVAVTSGDFSFLFTTWQGILLIILAIVNLFRRLFISETVFESAGHTGGSVCFAAFSDNRI